VSVTLSGAAPHRRDIPATVSHRTRPALTIALTTTSLMPYASQPDQVIALTVGAYPTEPNETVRLVLACPRAVVLLACHAHVLTIPNER
jgi:hypothetical protein